MLSVFVGFVKAYSWVENHLALPPDCASGLVLVAQLRHSFLVIFKRSSPGSTWHENLFLLFIRQAFGLPNEEVNENGGEYRKSGSYIEGIGEWPGFESGKSKTQNKAQSGVGKDIRS